MTIKQISIFTDGSCAPTNPGPGGYAAILTYKGHEREVTGCSPDSSTTNQQMELMAVIAGLQALKEKCQVLVYTDSEYVRGIFEKGWLEKWKRNGWKTSGKKPVKNKSLIMQLDKLVSKHMVNFDWVPAHAGVGMNERCDALAKEMAYKAGRLEKELEV